MVGMYDIYIYIGTLNRKCAISTVADHRHFQKLILAKLESKPEACDMLM